MNRKLLAAIVVIVLMGSAIGAYMYLSTPAKIEITYKSTYGNTQSSNFNTYVLIDMNITTDKNCQLNYGDFKLLCNGSPVDVMPGFEPSQTQPQNLESGKVNHGGLSIMVAGYIAGDFQLQYTGLNPVTLNNLGSKQAGL
jgi:hypothetical protein